MDYKKLFDEFFNNWRNNLKYLTKVLVRVENIKALEYLNENFNIQKYLSYYAGVYRNSGSKLLKLGMIKNYKKLAQGAIKSGNLDLFIEALKNHIQNYEELAIKAIKYNKINIVEYILLHYDVNLDILSKKALEYGHKNIIQYIENFKERIGEQIFLIPDEIIFKILISIPNLSKLTAISSNFKSYINAIIENYRNLFMRLTLSKDWTKNLRELTKILIYKNNINAVLFLLNNYNVQSYVSFYTGYFDNKELLNLNVIHDFQALAEGAARAGREKLVEMAVSKGAKNFEKIGQSAAFGDSVELVKYAISKGAINIPFMLDKAGEGNAIKVVKYLLKEYPNEASVNSLGYVAALNGHLDLVKYALENGANLINFIAYGAAKGNKLNVLEYLISKGANDFDGIAINATEGGHLNIVELAYDRGARNIEDIAAAAARYNQMDILSWAEKHGPINYQAIADNAAYAGDLELVKYAVSKGANNFQDIARNAALNNKLNVLKYAIENKANNLSELKNIAYRYSFNDILNYINELNEQSRTKKKTFRSRLVKKLNE